MPSYNVTIDDSSPLFRYSGVWDDSDSQDPEVSFAANGTFHSTTTRARVSLPFVGTAAYVYGSTGPGNGVFFGGVSDGSKLQQFSGTTPQDQYQILLASFHSLSSAQSHMLELVNSGTNAQSPRFDIDSVTITVGDGNPSTFSSDVVLDDTSPNITYSDGFPSCSNNLNSQYFDQTMHCSLAMNAQATIAFDGNAIALYGAVSTNHGMYSVRLDEGSSMVMNGTAPAFRPQTLIYYASGLASGSHTLVLTNLGTGVNGYVDLDRVIVSRWESFTTPANEGPSSHGGTTTKAGVASFGGAAPTYATSLAAPTVSLATAASTSSAGALRAAAISNTPVIVGAVVGSLLGLFVLVLVAFLLVRRFRNQSAQSASHREAGWNRAPAWGAEKSAAMMAEPPRWQRPRADDGTQ